MDLLYGNLLCFHYVDGLDDVLVLRLVVALTLFDALESKVSVSFNKLTIRVKFGC